jgi:AcrR family transcriptional regulator
MLYRPIGRLVKCRVDMPRRSVIDSRRTRERIVDRAVALASAEGFDAVTLGRLASQVEMSKAGVIGHFGSMESLQLAAVERAVESFRRQVWDPVADEPAGYARLLALCEAWLAYVGGDEYVGGCFTSAELSSFASVRTAVGEAMALWRAVVRNEVKAAIAADDLVTTQDPTDIAFQLTGTILAAGQSQRLGLDADPVGHARRAIRHVLGTSKGASDATTRPRGSRRRRA